MNIFSQSNEVHFKTRFLFAVIVYVILFCIGVYFDSESMKNTSHPGGCLGPIYMLINIIIGSPFIIITLLLDIIIMTIVSYVTLKKVLINLLVIFVFILFSIVSLF